MHRPLEQQSLWTEHRRAYEARWTSFLEFVSKLADWNDSTKHWFPGSVGVTGPMSK